MKTCAMLIAILILPVTSTATVQLASRGKARCPIITQPGATPAERHAAQELAATLEQITGAKFEIREAAEAPKAAILIGPGPAAAGAFPDIDLARLGNEQIVMRTRGDRLLLVGGRPRATLYSVYRFLQEQCGVRWWTPWATSIPKKPSLTVKELAVDYTPPFESRATHWDHSFDGDWAARHGINSMFSRLTEKHGGKIDYTGFVHTFYPLVPPDEHFKDHPEWYSLKNGKRIAALEKVDKSQQADQYGQLCTTNPELREFLVRQVKAWLRKSPEAKIISVSQNDWYSPCECGPCRAIDDEEGSHAGTMVALANHVAEQIRDEFPDVAVDTLAYQYTRKTPKSVRPLPNVIIRLCSIECSFAQPLEHPRNASFADDIRNWSTKSNRLYIWDYTTNFAHYPMPFPNYFSLGPNVRFFRKHGVKGLFEQGAYQGSGGEMAELKAWVLAQLLWNPDQDDRALIKEFCEGYYGKKAAGPIRAYLDLMSKAAADVHLNCHIPLNRATFLNVDTLSKAGVLWDRAEAAAMGKPDRLWRVRQGRASVWYAWLAKWDELKKQSDVAGRRWPLAESRKELAEKWLAVVTGSGPAGWTPMSHVDEGGVSPQQFAQQSGK